MKGQTKRCFEIIEAALQAAGADLKHVVRTRIFLTDMSRWQEAGEAHGEIFGKIEPATSFLGANALINPGWLVEVEADAVVAR
jgi:enamine deaminase RidA (YjgF/YER057c/UK114 family)